MTPDTQVTRIRVQYAKGDSLRFTGHLDLQRIWERTLRRSGLPLRYTQGYHPRARLNLASALPLGFTSDDELLDFWLDSPCPIEQIAARLQAALPPGLIIQSIQEVDLGEDALQVQMKASEYQVTFFDRQDPAQLRLRVDQLLSQVEIQHTRRKKSYNLRPLILDLAVVTNSSGECGLLMRLLAEPSATGRPDDLLDQLGYPNTDYLVRRTRLLLAEL
ncbi:MAG: TIGR03936 family radical SAM-associated protein [Brevefilum sp.]|nr:TIGR03936 family radical SAM-associated protein [Brevefilum sp.]